MTEPEGLRDPRAMDDEELEELPDEPEPVQPPSGPEAEPEAEYAEGQTNDPGGAHRDEPAGEDYAGSGF